MEIVKDSVLDKALAFFVDNEDTKRDAQAFRDGIAKLASLHLPKNKPPIPMLIFRDVVNGVKHITRYDPNGKEHNIRAMTIDGADAEIPDPFMSAYDADKFIPTLLEMFTVNFNELLIPTRVSSFNARKATEQRNPFVYDLPHKFSNNGSDESELYEAELYEVTYLLMTALDQPDKWTVPQ